MKVFKRTCRAHLLQADFSVNNSGETYCAVPTKEFARAERRNTEVREGTSQGSATVSWNER